MRSWRTAWRPLLQEAAKKAGREAAKAALAQGGNIWAARSAWNQAVHDLRHHCITSSRRHPEQTLMSIAAHVSAEMLEHFSHITMNARREAVAAIDSLKGGTQDPPGTWCATD